VPSPLRSLRIPSLLLQPIVENAIKHGIAPRRTGGLVSLHAAIDDSTLTLVVRDDGNGARNEDVRRGRSRGVGLANVERRLAVHYGAAATLRIDSGPGRGTIVEIRLPVDRIVTPSSHQARAAVDTSVSSDHWKAADRRPVFSHPVAAMADGPHNKRTGGAQCYRGTRKRLARIRLRGNSSIELWLFIVLVILLFAVVFPWVESHPPSPHRHPDAPPILAKPWEGLARVTHVKNAEHDGQRWPVPPLTALRIERRNRMVFIVLVVTPQRLGKTQTLLSERGTVSKNLPRQR
jgi:hypothetical protein